MDKERRDKAMWSIGFALACIIAGVSLEITGVTGSITAFGSVGNWLISIGVMAIIVAMINAMSKKRKIDERVEFISAKASRIVFLAFIVVAFALMVIDAITPITAPYFMVMSYMICGMTLVYAISYKWIEKRS